MCVCVWTVPHDSTDDVVEQFLSKILPGSGTVYRSDWHRRSTGAVSDERTTTSWRHTRPTTITRHRVCRMVLMDTDVGVQKKTLCFHVSGDILTVSDPMSETQLNALADS